MMNKLRTRLILLILGGSLFSIALVSIITNITVLRNFDIYMKNEQEQRLKEVIKIVEQSYDLNNGWTQEAIDDINTSPLIHNFDIEIKDQNNNPICTHNMENTMIQMHNEMMGRMGNSMMQMHNGMMGNGMMQMHNGMMGNNLREENYTVEEYDLFSNTKEHIGTIIIGYVGPFLVSESDIEFTKGINKSIFYGAIISVISAILLGIFSSKIFSKPILKITEAANDIRKGKLGTKVEISNNIVELNDLSKSINHLSKSLEEQELLRKRLTSDISHELRTPLTVLQSHIEAISDGIWEPTKDKLDICKNEVIRLIKLVEELKNLTDIENHKLNLEIKNYSLSKDLNEIIESFEYQFQEKRIKINTNIKENIQIYGDKDKIRQAIVNLLSNALKFTNIGGTINIDLLENEEQVNIIVEDTGIGIAEQDIPYVFERFYRSDESRNRKTGGTGIGLTITKTLIEAHKGRITVESRKDKGSKFTIMLPKK